MNHHMIRYLLSKLLVIEAVFLVVPLITALIYRENQTTITAILLTMALLLLVGTCGALLRPKNRRIYTKEGMLLVALCWILWSVFAALPYVFSGQIPNFTDAFFEMVSGFTTTGATILPSTNQLSHSLLLWRSLTQLIGGMGVLVFAVAILDNTNNNHLEIVRAEMAGPVFGKVVAKLKNTAQLLYLMYMSMFILLTLTLWLIGLPFFDSLVTAMATAGTGGFAGHENNISYYNNSLVTSVVAIGMLLFGINFNLYYLLLVGKIRTFFKNQELRLYLKIIASSIFLIWLNVGGLFSSTKTALEAISFQVIATITSTGFNHSDINVWPLFSQVILLSLMCCGGMAGSTAGGFKLMRVLILIKIIKSQILATLYPNRVLTLQIDDNPIDNKVQTEVLRYLAIYCLLWGVGLLVITLDSNDFLVASSAVFSTINNNGPLLGTVNNFNIFSPFSKLFLAFLMIAGRLELYPMILFFLPKTWSKR